MRSLIIVCALLGGCATQLQAVQGLDAAAVVSVRAANDIALSATKQAYCSMTVDTLNRHPEDVAGVKALCWTNSATTASDAATMLIAPVK